MDSTMTGYQSKKAAAKMKLYNVPKRSQIVLKDGTELHFHHIDGAYSFCTDVNNEVYHISASEEVRLKEKSSITFG